MKIKDFSELTGLSIRTLQFYDKKGILEPEEKDEHGFRWYGSASFSKAFVIRSLKEIGMTLEEIQHYFSDHYFSLSDFANEQIIQKENEIQDLQKQIILLENLRRNLSNNPFEVPEMIPLLSTMESFDQFFSNSKPDFSMKSNFSLFDYYQFINDLEFCRNNQLGPENEIAQKCIKFWESVLSVWESSQNEVIEMTKSRYSSEKDSHGMTSENYFYLNDLLIQNSKRVPQ